MQKQSSLRHRFLQLQKTTRKGASKVLRLKTGHSMLNQHESKIDQNWNVDLFFEVSFS